MGEPEAALFKRALQNMHLLYGNPRWRVYRLSYVPTDAANPVAYIDRGWCFFESTVASVGCSFLTVIEGAKDCQTTVPTPVPLLPHDFNEELDEKQFTQKGADLDMVKTWYAKIFPSLLLKDTDMIVYGWEEADLQRFL